jgi:hypothetical protein
MPCAQNAAAAVAKSAARRCANTVAAAAAAWAALLHCKDRLEDVTHAVTVVNVSHGVLPQTVTQAQGDDPAGHNGSSKYQAVSVSQRLDVDIIENFCVDHNQSKR